MVTVHCILTGARNSKGSGTNFRRQLLTRLGPATAEKLSQTPSVVNAYRE